MWGSVRVEVVKITDYSCPIFVECELIDSHGKKHIFHDKHPIFFSNYDVVIPCRGEMNCKIIKNNCDTVIIDTSEPDDIESDEGNYIFEVDKELVKYKC
ncbi:MAG: hypothetical protein K2N72_05405 [Oscillospiraceae bacterium]|nr:hypothetical protein [Oscillospiraceae bacterium]